MITIRPSAERGRSRTDWLDSRHTFSFGEYFDPDQQGFADLRVLNQDLVLPGRGFGTHAHRDMEIVSYVLDGVLQHRDSLGNGSQVRPGEVQLMSAGTGVTHSEFNASSTEPLHFLQMWVLPASRGTRPRYEQRAFPEADRRGRLRLVVSPDGADGSLTIGQDARLFAGSMAGAEQVRFALPPGRSAWLHVARGSLRLNGQPLQAGDGAAVEHEQDIVLDGGEAAEMVLWELTAGD